MRRSLSIAGVKTIPAILLALLIHNSTTAAAPLVGAAASGLDGKIIVGYQGWFGCPGDFPGNTSWLHW
ncbi:MAG TPA: hypothetical protein VGR45_11810, partial [Stellaceae bacterium]|nr:hypothetical protein [Stellaceae bacterium]